MKTPKMLGWVVGLLLWTGGSSAAQAPVVEVTVATRAERLAEQVVASRLSSGVTETVTVVGYAWYRNDRPVEHPVLRIRDLRNGEIVGQTVGSERGEFRFDQLTAGLYLLELIGEGDTLLAVGQPLDVRSGETVGTFILLGAAPAADQFGLASIERFGGSASQVIEAGAGVPVIGGGNAASNER